MTCGSRAGSLRRASRRVSPRRRSGNPHCRNPHDASVEPGRTNPPAPTHARGTRLKADAQMAEETCSTNFSNSETQIALKGRCHKHCFFRVRPTPERQKPLNELQSKTATRSSGPQSVFPTNSDWQVAGSIPHVGREWHGSTSAHLLPSVSVHRVGAHECSTPDRYRVPVSVFRPGIDTRLLLEFIRHEPADLGIRGFSWRRRLRQKPIIYPP